MDSATWCRTFAATSAASRLRPEVSKNSSTALSSNEGELARSITTCVPAMASLSPSPVMVLIPLRGEPATTSWPPRRRMATVFEPIRPVPPMATIFIVLPPLPKRTSIRRLLVEPDILHAMVVVDAVDHHGIALDVGMPAGARAVVVQNRPGNVLGQAALDLEHDRLALLLIGLHRLLLEQLV